MVFLDASPVIYLIEGDLTWGHKVASRLAAMRAVGEKFAVSDLVRMECLVGPYKTGDLSLLADFQTFFASPEVQILAINAAVSERAARIRAQCGFKPLDSLHLACAVEHGCTLFLTNDGRLLKFPDISVEILT